MSKGKKLLTEKTLSTISNNRQAPWAGFFILLVVYFVTNYFTIMTARSEDVIFIMGQPTPLRMLTGVFSAIGNISIIFLVVFYKRRGFVVALLILMFQFPNLFIGMFVNRNFAQMSGIATNLLSMAAVILIHINDSMIDSYQERIRQQAVTDGLTGLPNRYAASELMRGMVKRGEKFVYATFDLDNFKNINNTMGHSTGDEILKEIAERWKNAADQSVTGTLDFVAYNGGDEYALAIREYESEEQVISTLGIYESLIEEKMTFDDCDFFVTSSIGYAEYPTDGSSADAILSHANAAMYSAKRKGNHLARFTNDMSRDEYMLEMERSIRFALENDTLFFHLQPQYDIDHNLRGFEALARMKGPDGKMISPADFVPVAEHLGIIDKIDNTVFRKSAMFMGDLIKATGTEISLSVNVSVRHLMKNDFIDEVRDILDSCGVPAGQIEIEITESVMIDSVDKALECINELKRMGIRIAIDDFGTGYSSLSYLNEFPADVLKVDKSFIDKMNESDSSRQYVSAIISIGHVMNFNVISEGVEEEHQLDTLRDIGCDYIQGYLWGRPMEAEQAAELVGRPA